MIEELKNEIQAKIKELEWRNNVRSLELIEWLNSLLKKMEVKEETKEEVKEVKVELPVEEKKETPKKKISFKRK